MRRALWLLLAVTILGGATATADLKIGGYLAPHLILHDNGEDYKGNLGFGMYFNRFTFKGSLEGGDIVKRCAWKVESDISESGSHSLQWSFLQPYFTEGFSLRFGHIKRQYSMEILHSTSELMTAMRHPTTSFLKDLGYGGYTYGLEVHLMDDIFSGAAGAYASGTPKRVTEQDPALDYAARALFSPLEDFDVGVNVCMATLPIGGSNLAVYDDSLYESNTGLAYGLDLNYHGEFDGMSLWVQAELGMGDNWSVDEGGGPKDPGAGDTWEDFEWYSFMYYYLKFRFMFTEDLGVHFGYSSIDPNTDDVGKNDEITMMTPGFTYFWTPFCRTQAEMQIHTVGGGVDGGGTELDDLEYTHFVLQQVLVWK